MKGWRTIAFNLLTVIASIFGGSEILKYIDAQTAIMIVASANIGLRLITSTAVGAGLSSDAATVGKSWIVLLMAGSLTACTSLPTFSEVAPTICAYASNEQSRSAARMLLEKLPPGTDKDRAIEAERIAEVSADASCVLVKALEARQSK